MCASLRLGPLALVDDHQHRALLPAQPAGEVAVGWSEAQPAIDQKKGEIAVFEGRGGLGRHARFQACRIRYDEPGGVDHAEAQGAKLCRALAPVARDARSGVDDRGASPDQPVEQRRFADIGAATDHHGERHGFSAER